MSSGTEKIVNQFKAIIKEKSLDLSVNQDAAPEKKLISLFEQMAGRVQALSQEKKALKKVISETTNQFQERILDLSLVRRFGEDLDIFVSMEEFNNKLLDILIEELGAENCSIMIVDKATDELVLQAGRNRGKEDFKTPTKERRVRIGEGIAGLVAREGRAMLLANVAE